MPSIQDIQKQHAKWVDQMTAAFETHLHRIMAAALANLAGDLQKRLSITNGKVDRTPGNVRTLRTLEKRFLEQLNASGLQALLVGFTNEFAQQNVFAQQIMKAARKRRLNA